MKKETQKILTQPMFYVLLSLKEVRHGYEIMQYVEWLTKGRVKIGPGTLYSLLSKFEEDGWIKMVSDYNNKKTYKIDPLGEEAIVQEMERLELLLNDAARVKEGNEDEFQNRK